MEHLQSEEPFSSDPYFSTKIAINDFWIFKVPSFSNLILKKGQNWTDFIRFRFNVWKTFIDHKRTSSFFPGFFCPYLLHVLNRQIFMLISRKKGQKSIRIAKNDLFITRIFLESSRPLPLISSSILNQTPPSKVWLTSFKDGLQWCFSICSILSFPSICLPTHPIVEEFYSHLIQNQEFDMKSVVI